MQEPARAKNLSITVDYDAELPGWVIGDPRRLRQVLVNLLGNAIKFTLQGEVRLTVHPVNTQICFAVIDTGIGMNDEQTSRLFKAFEQANRLPDCSRPLSRPTARPHAVLVALDWDSP